jgi:hypothetical protein
MKYLRFMLSLEIGSTPPTLSPVTSTRCWRKQTFMKMIRILMKVMLCPGFKITKYKLLRRELILSSAQSIRTKSIWILISFYKHSSRSVNLCTLRRNQVRHCRFWSGLGWYHFIMPLPTKTSSTWDKTEVCLNLSTTN